MINCLWYYKDGYCGWGGHCVLVDGTSFCNSQIESYFTLRERLQIGL